MRQQSQQGTPGCEVSPCLSLDFLLARIALGLRKPKKAIPGMIVAGEIESVGKEVKHFKKGDQIYALDLTRLSAYAEYACLPENSVIAFKPSTVTYEEAAAIPFVVMTALHFLKRGKIHSGQHVLIYGASSCCWTSTTCSNAVGFNDKRQDTHRWDSSAKN